MRAFVCVGDYVNMIFEFVSASPLANAPASLCTLNYYFIGKTYFYWEYSSIGRDNLFSSYFSIYRESENERSGVYVHTHTPYNIRDLHNLHQQ